MEFEYLPVFYAFSFYPLPASLDLIVYASLQLFKKEIVSL